MIDIQAFEPGGYRPGTIGQCAAMLASHYCPTLGFDARYEADTAVALAGFCAGFDAARDGLWIVRGARGEVLGCTAIDGAQHYRGLALLRWVFVSESLRGRGIGQRLLDLAIAHCDARGYTHLELYTHRRLQAAIHLYEKNGFVHAGRKPCRHWGVDVPFEHFVRPLPVARVSARARTGQSDAQPAS